MATLPVWFLPITMALGMAAGWVLGYVSHRRETASKVADHEKLCRWFLANNSYIHEGSAADNAIRYLEDLKGCKEAAK